MFLVLVTPYTGWYIDWQFELDIISQILCFSLIDGGFFRLYHGFFPFPDFVHFKQLFPRVGLHIWMKERWLHSILSQF